MNWLNNLVKINGVLKKAKSPIHAGCLLIFAMRAVPLSMASSQHGSEDYFRNVWDDQQSSLTAYTMFVGDSFLKLF